MLKRGIDPWTHLDAMLLAPNNKESFKAAEAWRDDFLDAWASGIYRASNIGGDWYETSRWQSGAAPERATITLQNDTIEKVFAVPVTNFVAEVLSRADIV